MWFKGFSQILKAYTPRFLSLLCSFLFSASLIAQINIQVGYGLSFMDLAENTQILQKYNASNAWLSSGFGAIKVLNGLQIGLRYTGRIGSCGFNWTYGQANTKAEGLNPSDNLEYNRTIYYKLESYNFLLETGSQWIQFGTSINLNYLSIKDKFTPNTNKTQITRQTAWGSQFYINVGLSNGSVCRIALQPYYFLPWEQFELSPLEQALNGSSGIQSGNFKHFGIRLLLLNGPQRD